MDRRSPCSLVDAFAASGISRRAFCARHGVSVNTFDWWRKRLSTETSSAPAVRPGVNALFVELSSPLAVAATDARHTAPAWDLELELGAGIVLRLRRGAAC